jgi:hypothetical protein
MADEESRPGGRAARAGGQADALAPETIVRTGRARKAIPGDLGTCIASRRLASRHLVSGMVTNRECRQ